MGCFLPFVAMTLALVVNSDTPDQLQQLELQTGTIAIDMLLLCLLITPLRELMSTPTFTPWRKIFGLWAFAYSFVHVLIYFYGNFTAYGSDYISQSIDEILGQDYLLYGTVSLMLLIPLAITSNRKSQRFLRKRWVSLHTMIYFVGAAACIHLALQGREEWGQAAGYFFGYILLMLARLYYRHMNRVRMARDMQHQA